MHDALRRRLLRTIESLPEERLYQVLDYIEFLESRYGAGSGERSSSGFQRFAEGLEDRMRKRAFNPSNLREAFQVIAAADRALSGVTQAGRKILDELAGGGQGSGQGDRTAAEAKPEGNPDDARQDEGRSSGWENPAS